MDSGAIVVVVDSVAHCSRRRRSRNRCHRFVGANHRILVRAGVITLQQKLQRRQTEGFIHGVVQRGPPVPVPMQYSGWVSPPQRGNHIPIGGVMGRKMQR